ncbi:MAG: hypothetical protein QXO51_02435 [Halobacteria archaeon]
MVAGLPLRVVVFGVAGAAGAALVASALLGFSGQRCADQAWGELQRVAERARTLASLVAGSLEADLRLPGCVEAASFDATGRFTLRAAGELRQGHAGTPLSLSGGSLVLGPGPHRLVLTTDGSAVQISEA